MNAQHEKFGDLPRFLDSLIQDYGDYLFVVVANIGVAVVIWILVRRRRSTAGQAHVAVFLQRTQAKQDPESEPHPFDDSQSR